MGLLPGSHGEVFEKRARQSVGVGAFMAARRALTPGAPFHAASSKKPTRENSCLGGRYARRALFVPAARLHHPESLSP